MRQATKQKIIDAVDQYKQQFPEEYKAFIAQTIERRKDLRSEFAEAKGKYALKRVLMEMPETLHNIINDKLDVGEVTEFSAKEAVIWFARTYKEFALPEKI
jgi:hypothetical protein